VNGLLLKFNLWSDNIIKVLFDHVDTTRWTIEILYWESFEKKKLPVDFNDPRAVSSKLAKWLFLESEYDVVPEFAKILIRPRGSRKAEIVTHGQFMQSSYFLSLIIIDHRNIEICGKDPELLHAIEMNFLDSDLQNKRFRELHRIPPHAVLNPWRSRNDLNIYDEDDLN